MANVGHDFEDEKQYVSSAKCRKGSLYGVFRIFSEIIKLLSKADLSLSLGFHPGRSQIYCGNAACGNEKHSQITLNITTVASLGSKLLGSVL